MNHYLRLFSFVFLFNLCQNLFAYTPQVGDLYFQDLNCGSLCNAITSVTFGYDQTEVSHVALLIQASKNPEVIEAIGKDVHLTPLAQFLNRSLDKNKNPRVFVGRLKAKYQRLIPQAITYMKSWLYLPYNKDFNPNNHYKSFYCSELVDQGFYLANDKKHIFPLNKMTFKKDGQTLPQWQAYFKAIDKDIPEGEIGTNPGLLSRSKAINIIYFYGKLRTIKTS